jgi:ribosomal protein S18 acetylase RimI-like enzyme
MSADVLSVAPPQWRLVRELRLRALADSPLSFGSSLERELGFDEVDWIGLVSRGGWFCAMSNAVPVGIAAGMTGDGLDPGEAHLLSFWVEPESRGRGVAVALLDSVRNWATSSGASRLTLWVADESAAARRFYRRMGFEATGRRQPLPSNPAVGEELMTMELRSPTAIGDFEADVVGGGVE